MRLQNLRNIAIPENIRKKLYEYEFRSYWYKNAFPRYKVRRIHATGQYSQYIAKGCGLLKKGRLNVGDYFPWTVE